MIIISKLSYRYSRRKVLFNALDLRLQPGKVYGLLGKNGAGKSSLIKNIAGLLIPTEGSCTVFGQEPRQRSSAFLQEMFFIPEETDLPKLSLPDFVRIYSAFYPRFSAQDFERNLATFNLGSDLHLQQLSFGQKKKLYIAFALATNTTLLIMDEPTNGLDIPSKLQFRKLVAETALDEKITIVSTHQVRDLDDLIDSILIMDDSNMLLHADKKLLQHKLYFTIIGNDADENALYSEPVPGGRSAIYSNKDGKESYLDIEVLFNATLSLKEKFTSIINA